VRDVTSVTPYREKPADLVDGEDRQRPGRTVRTVNKDVDVCHHSRSVGLGIE